MNHFNLIKPHLPKYYTSVDFDWDSRWPGDSNYAPELEAYLAGDDSQLVNASNDLLYACNAYDDAEDYEVKEIADAVDFELTDEDEQFIREHLHAIDSIDHLAGRAHGNYLMRQTLAKAPQVPAEAAYGDTMTDDTPRREWLAQVLTGAGLEVTGANADAFDTLITEGPWDWWEGVRVDLLWYGPMHEVNRPSPYEDRTVVFTDPVILLNDPNNGSGTEARFSGQLTTTFTKDRPAYLDQAVEGYSWTETAGPYEPYFQTEIKDA